MAKNSGGPTPSLFGSITDMGIQVTVNDNATREALKEGYQVLPIRGEEDELPVERGAKFYKIAQFSRSNKMNIFEIMQSLTKPEMRLITEVSYGFSYKKFTTKLHLSKLSKSERSNKYRTYAALKKKELVRRVGTDAYMINPELLIPSNVNKEKEAIRIWELNA